MSTSSTASNSVVTEIIIFTSVIQYWNLLRCFLPWLSCWTFDNEVLVNFCESFEDVYHHFGDAWNIVMENMIKTVLLPYEATMCEKPMWKLFFEN